MLAYKFRLFPNKEEERKLLWTKDACRQICTKFLGHKLPDHRLEDP